MSRPTDLVVDALAAYRLTRLVTRDKITAPLRAPLVDRPGLAGELVSCEWCVGVWASFGVVALRRLVPGAWAPVADALALAAVVGLIAENG